jgi:hypothetical protein
VTTSDSASCSDCGAPRNSDEETSLCSTCGSTAITRQITVVEEIGFGDDSLSVGVEFAPGPRPWREKWSRLLLDLDTIRRSYAGQLGFQSTDAWASTIASFLGSAHHLYEWIEHDPQVPAAATAASHSYMQGDPFLKIAEGISNTDKHHTRDHGIQTAIGKMTVDSTGCTAEIAWRHVKSGAAGRIDALDLAEGCVAAWKAFISSHGLA